MQTKGSKLLVPLPVDLAFLKNHELLQTYQLARLFANHRSGAEGHWSVVKIVAGADQSSPAKAVCYPIRISRTGG